MRRYLVGLIGATILALSASTPATATVLATDFAPGTTVQSVDPIDTGNNATHKAATAFTLTSRATVTSIAIHTTVPLGSSINQLSYFILDFTADPFNSGGPPAGVTVLDSGLNVPLTGGFFSGSGPLFQVNSDTFQVTPVTLDPGTYILEIQDGNLAGAEWTSVPPGVLGGWNDASLAPSHLVAAGGFYQISGSFVTTAPEVDPASAAAPVALIVGAALAAQRRRLAAV